MRKKTFYLLSMSFFVFALITNLVSKTRFSNVSIGVATASERNRILSAMLKRALNEGQMFEKQSYCFAILGVFFWVTSVVRREQSCHAVLFVLLFAFLLAEFLFV
ncbi:MAG: hypothetical protein ACOX5G_01155 [Kiritimatiellia bacterium]|jgi:hypothetical protein